jgi:hypothetical protein
MKPEDGSVEGHKHESEFYRQILRRAKRVRERAAESLRRSRGSRKTQGDLGEADAAQKAAQASRRDWLSRERHGTTQHKRDALRRGRRNRP